MGREVRRVPADWQHPINPTTGHHIPLSDGFTKRLREWNDENDKWNRGEFPDYARQESRAMTYLEWEGDPPKECDYMPDWPAEQRTHLMMYEDTSEGTPISPAFATPEELAHWLADTGASSFGGSTASYEAWLKIARGGWAPSLIYSPSTGLIDGVSASLGK